MVSVGLWGAQLGAPAIWLLPVTFPVVMAFGGMLGLIGVPLPGVEIGIAISGIILGMAVLSEWRPPLWCCRGNCGYLCHFLFCYAHGTELPAGASGMLYSIGFVMATGLLHGCGISIGLIHRWTWGRWALRVAGFVVAVAGAEFLVAGDRMTRPSGVARKTVVGAASLLLLPVASFAHLSSTGLGPFYDGLTHFWRSPEEIIPVLALAFLAGLRGPRAGR